MVGLTKAAMAAGALAFPDGFALADAATPARQALEVATHVDVPGGDLGRRGSATDGLHALALRLSLRHRCGGLCGKQHTTAERGQ